MPSLSRVHYAFARINRPLGGGPRPARDVVIGLARHESPDSGDDVRPWAV